MSDPSQLRVVIRDRDGRPVRDARVAIEAAPVPVPDVAALTDAQGELTLSVPVAGRYRLRCAAEGFDSASAEVEIGAAPGARLVVELDRAR